MSTHRWSFHMSAAFDTVDHNILITCLEKRISLTGSAITWICSYLSDRTQSVKIQDGTSDGTKIAFGIPHWGLCYSPSTRPQLVTSSDYTTTTCTQTTYNYDLYADNIQLYVKFNITDENDRQSSLRKIKQCVNVRMWMNANLLEINEDKMVMLVIASRNDQKKHNITMIKIDDCDIILSPGAYNIGVAFDAEVSIVYHVQHICRTAYNHLSIIASIRSCLTKKAVVQIIHSLVIATLDLSPNCTGCKTR